MARKTVEKVYSDISGDEIAENSSSLRFAFDGTSYEIDLTDDERAKFEEALSPYVAAARKSGTATRRQKTSSTGGPDPKAVRAWAIEKNIDVPSRGRIPASVLEAYNSSN